MPVWWSVFAYMIFVSAFGMIIYKSRAKETVIGYVDTSEEKRIKYGKSIGIVFAFLTFALLIFFVGQRSFISDTAIYQGIYDKLNPDLNQIWQILTSDEKGRLYTVLQILFKHFTNGSYNDWFTFVAIWQSISVILLLYKHSINYTFSVYLFLVSGTTIWMINGIRQYLAVTFILYFVDDIIKRKTIRFIIVIIIAWMIHSSAIFWIPVYFIVNYEPWSKKYIILSTILIIALYVFSTTSLIDDTEFGYLRGDDFKVGVNPFRVIVMAMPSIIAFWKRKQIQDKLTPFLQICVNLSVITTGCYLVGMFTSGIIGRLPIYFQIFNYVLLPWLLKEAYDEDMSKTMILIAIVMYFIFFYYEMVITGSGLYASETLGLSYWTTN